MKRIESTGKTIEEALEAGLRQLGCTIGDVTWVALQEGSKGLFGLFGSRPAKVAITLNDDEDEVGSSILGGSIFSSLSYDEGGLSEEENDTEASGDTLRAKPEAKRPGEAKPPQPRPAPEKRLKPETRPEIKAEPPKAEPRPAPKPEAAQPKIEPRPRVEPKPRPEPESRPGQRARPEPRPLDRAASSNPVTGLRHPKPPVTRTAPRPPQQEEMDDDSGMSAFTPLPVETPSEPPVMHPQDTSMGIAQQFLIKLTTLMGVSVQIYVREDEDKHLYVQMHGDTLGVLIGRRGETLDSLQYLTSLIVNRDREEYLRVTLDTENYRAKREDALRRLAIRMANRAVKSGRRVVLEPMNPYERRILHATLQGFPGIATHSEGEEPNRHVVITLKRAESPVPPKG